ncbi:MAG: MFS transporter [Actinobacteria bacterium]|nr:MFS transporter [Actinomycetota bacterium]
MEDDFTDKEECGIEPECLVSDSLVTVPGKTVFKGSVMSALGIRDFSLMWSGALLSNIGTWIQTTVLLWYVKELTGTNAWVGAVNLASYLPVLLFVMIAGSLADRLNRKKLVLITQTVMMMGAIALAALTAFDAAGLPAIMIIVAVMGTAFAFSHPAWQAMVPDIIGQKDLLNAIALNSAQFNLARFIGPAIGAIVLAGWNAAGGFLVNAVSFVFVIIAILMVKTKTPPIHTKSRTHQHILEAVRYAWKNSWARNLLLITAFISFFGLAYIVLSPTMAQDVLDKGSSGYGLILMSSGLGAFLAAPLVTFINRHIGKITIIKYSAALSGSCLIGFAVSRIFWLSLVFCFFMGLGYLMAMASINTILQLRTGREMMGRIMSFYILMLIGIFPIGGQVMGIVADLKSAPFAIFICGSAIVVLCLGLFIFPSVTREASVTA